MDLTPDEVIATTPSTQLGCEAPPEPIVQRGRTVLHAAQVHRGRWLKAERDRRVPGRVMCAPEGAAE